MNSNNKDLVSRLNELTPKKKLAFLLLMCDRIYPALEKFSIQTGFNIQRYEDCLDKGWKFLVERSSLFLFEEASQYCYENAPDTENFQHDLVSAALNSTLSIGLLMDFISDGNIDHIVEVSELAQDTVALHVQVVEAASPLSLSIAKITQHPFMQAELKRQREDLNFLLFLPEDVGAKEVADIKSRSKSAPAIIPLDHAS